MAKGNLIQGTGRGKLGDVVLYRSEGEQMARVRIRKIKNPKTQAQQIQRAIAATTTQAYSGMSAIVDHSFEGIQYGVKSMNYFNKINMDDLRTRAAEQSKTSKQTHIAAFTAPKVSTLVPTTWIMSRGSLNNNVWTDVIKNRGTYPRVGNGYKWEPTSENPGLKDVKFGEFISHLGILSANTMLTWTQITPGTRIIYTVPGNINATAGAYLTNTKFEYVRIMRNGLEVEAEDYESLMTDDNLSTLIAKYFKYFDRQFFEALAADSIKGSTYLHYPIGDETDTIVNVAGCCIKSELVNGTWKRSSEALVILDSFDDGKENYTGLTYNYMVQAWTDQNIQLGKTDWYLNGGGSSERIDAVL